MVFPTATVRTGRTAILAGVTNGAGQGARFPSWRGAPSMPSRRTDYPCRWRKDRRRDCAATDFDSTLKCGQEEHHSAIHHSAGPPRGRGSQEMNRWDSDELSWQRTWSRTGATGRRIGETATTRTRRPKRRSNGRRSRPAAVTFSSLPGQRSSYFRTANAVLQSYHETSSPTPVRQRSAMIRRDTASTPSPTTGTQCDPPTVHHLLPFISMASRQVWRQPHLNCRSDVRRVGLILLSTLRAPAPIPGEGTS